MHQWPDWSVRHESEADLLVPHCFTADGSAPRGLLQSSVPRVKLLSPPRAARHDQTRAATSEHSIRTPRSSASAASRPTLTQLCACAAKSSHPMSERDVYTVSQWERRTGLRRTRPLEARDDHCNARKRYSINQKMSSEKDFVCIYCVSFITE